MSIRKTYEANQITGRGIVYEYEAGSQSLYIVDLDSFKRVRNVAQGDGEIADYLFNHFHVHNLSYNTLFRFFAQKHLPLEHVLWGNRERIEGSNRFEDIVRAARIFLPYTMTLMGNRMLKRTLNGTELGENLFDIETRQHLTKIEEARPMSKRRLAAHVGN